MSRRSRLLLSIPSLLLALQGCSRVSESTGVETQYIIPRGSGTDDGWGFGIEGWLTEGWGVRGGYHWIPAAGKRAFAVDVGAAYSAELVRGFFIDLQAGMGAYWVRGDFAAGPVAAAGVTLYFIPDRLALSARYVYAPVSFGGFPADELSRISLGLGFKAVLE